MRHNQVISPTAGVGLWKLAIAGGWQRKTRLHDELGASISIGRAARNLPRAFASGVLRIVANKRPERPWISYDAQAVLAKHLTKESHVCEFGSGMSTIWYGRHAGQVVSIEDNEDWYHMISGRMRALGNVEHHFAGDPQAYVGLAPERDYDLITIDGHWRDKCAESP